MENLTVCSGTLLGKRREMWVRQVMPVLMEMYDNVRGDGQARGILIASPGKHYNKIVVDRFAVSDGFTLSDTSGGVVLTPITIEQDA